MPAWRILVLPSCNKLTSASWQNRSMPMTIHVAALFLVTWLASALPAQTSNVPAPASPRPSQPTRRRPTIDDRVKAFAKGLDLSETQQIAVKKILQERQQETLRIRTDPSIPGSQRIDRFRALQDQTVMRIRAVLNDEQKKKYDPLAVRKLSPAPNQKSVEDWLKETTPK